MACAHFRTRWARRLRGAAWATAAAVAVGGDGTGNVAEQLLAVAAWLRGRYESAPPAELAMLAAVIGYLETLAEQAAPSQAPEGEEEDPQAGPAVQPHWSQAVDGGSPLRGVFRETAAGGTVTDETGEVRELPHVVVAAAGLRHGDRVGIRPLDDPRGNCYYTRTGATAPVGPSRVREGVGVLSREGPHLRVAVDGRILRAVAAHPHLGALNDGAPVSVRYEPETSGRADPVAYVVRVHEAAQAPAVPAVRRSLRPLRPAEETAAMGEAAGPAAATPVERALPRILIVGGHPRARLHYGQAMDGVAHVEWVHGQRVTPSLRRRVETARAIVLVTQHMTHPVSNYIMRVLRETHKPCIHARSQNHSGLARQIVDELLPQLDADAAPPPPGPQA